MQDTSLQIQELRSLDEIKEISDEWNLLAQQSRQGSPYVIPQFIIPWLKRMGDKYCCCFLAAWDDKKLVGLAPIIKRQICKLGLSISILEFPSGDPAPVCEILTHEDSTGVIDAFEKYWLSNIDWDVIDLRNMPEKSIAAAEIRKISEKNTYVTTFRKEPSTYYIPLDICWNDYLAARPRSFRRRLRRGKKLCEKLGEYTYTKYPGDLNFSDALESVFIVVSNSWKNHEDGQNGWNMFLRRFIKGLEEKNILNLSFLNIDGKPVSYQLDVAFQGKMYGMHNAYDLHYQKASVGMLMLAYGVERAIESKCNRYITGYKDYLKDWTQSTESYSGIRLQQSSLFSRFKVWLYYGIQNLKAYRVRLKTESSKKNLKLKYIDNSNV